MRAEATPVEAWFGPDYSRLHPQLRALHRDGGHLTGPLVVTLGRGLAGWVGTRLARRLGIPMQAASNTLTVAIRSDADGLHWDRCFNGSTNFRSVFRPVGTFPSGHWLEQSGRLRLALGVDLRDGGWRWVSRRAWLGPVPVPLWLLPRTTAGKWIDAQGGYRFSVRLAWPVLGTLLSYAGTLHPVTNDTTARAPAGAPPR